MTSFSIEAHLSLYRFACHNCRLLNPFMANYQKQPQFVNIMPSMTTTFPEGFHFLHRAQASVASISPSRRFCSCRQRQPGCPVHSALPPWRFLIPSLPGLTVPINVKTLFPCRQAWLPGPGLHWDGAVAQRTAEISTPGLHWKDARQYAGFCIWPNFIHGKITGHAGVT